MLKFLLLARFTHLRGLTMNASRKLMLMLVGPIASLLFVGVSNAKELSKEDIENAFSNMTVGGFHNKKKFSFTRYYDPSGKLYALSEKKGKRIGTWSAKEGQLCEKFGKNHCRKVEKSDGRILKYHKGKLIVTYKVFSPGNNLEAF